MRKFGSTFFGALLVMGCGALSNTAVAGGMDSASYKTEDPPRRVFPGKFFEYKAAF